MAMASYDGDAAGGALGGMAVASSSSSSSVVSAEERQLQLDFHALLADYVVGRRKVERHPDAEQRFLVEEKFLKRAEDRLRDSAKRLRELPGERRREGAAARRWEVEADTWMLLGLRREDLDYPSQGPFRDAPVVLRPGHLKDITPEELEAFGLVEKSALKVMEECLNHQKEFRRLVLLVTWLELLRERDLWLLRDEVDGLEGYEMWPTTCQREQALALDPDFPYHAGQGGGLAPVDERQDLLLLERIWRFLRAGRLEEAADLCQRCGQAWRAASISGGDPWDVFPRPEDQAQQPPHARVPYKWVNNLRPLLWRRMCATLAERLARGSNASKVARMERTVYAALALDPALLLRVGEPALVSGWEDRAWAAFRAKMEWELHLTLRQLRRARRRHSNLYPDLVAAGPDEEGEDGPGGRHVVVGEALRERSVAQVFASIEEAAKASSSSSGGGLSSTATSDPAGGGGDRGIDLLAERRVQAGLMQGELIEALAASLPSPEGLTSLAGATGGRGGDEEAARLRLWAHAALFVVETEGRRAFRRQGPHVQAKVFAVLKHYMRRCLWKGEQEGEERMEGLPSPSHVPLLALYASFLPARDRRRLFSEYMEGVHTSSLRAACREQALSYMGLHDVGIVVAEIQEHLRTSSDAELLALVSSLRSRLLPLNNSSSSTRGYTGGGPAAAAAEQDLFGLPEPMLAYRDRGRLGDADAFRVKALEWLDDPRLSRQALVHATALLRATVMATAAGGQGQQQQQQAAGGVIFSDALLAIVGYGESVLGLGRGAAVAGGGGGDVLQSIGEGTAAYRSHADEWAAWKAMAEAQAAFLRWTREASGFDLRRREVAALLQARRHGGGGEAASGNSSVGAAVDADMATLARAVHGMAEAATAMAGKAREAAVALMRILWNADVWLASNLGPEDWALLKAEEQQQGQDDEEESASEEEEEDAMDVVRRGPQGRRQGGGGGGARVLNPVERHIFATGALRRREEELGKLKATCLPEMAALLQQVLHDTARALEGAFVGGEQGSAAAAAEEAAYGGDGGTRERFRAVAAKCYMWALQLASLVADPRTALHEYFPRGRFAAPPQRASLLPDPFSLDDFLARCQASARGLLRLRGDTEWAALAREAAVEAPWRVLEEEEEGEEEEGGELGDVEGDED